MLMKSSYEKLRLINPEWSKLRTPWDWFILGPVHTFYLLLSYYCAESLDYCGWQSHYPSFYVTGPPTGLKYQDEIREWNWISPLNTIWICVRENLIAQKWRWSGSSPFQSNQVFLLIHPCCFQWRFAPTSPWSPPTLWQSASMTIHS